MPRANAEVVLLLGVGVALAFTAMVVAWRTWRSRENSPSWVNALPDALIHVTAEGLVLAAHVPAGPLERWGLRAGEALSPRLPPAVGPALVSAIDSCLQLGVPQHFELAIPFEGHALFYEVRVVPQGEAKVVVLLRDITLRQQVERANDQRQRRRFVAANSELLATSERLVALGSLAAGVAHEINNPLSIIASNLGYIDGELANPDQLPEVREAVRDSIEAASRVREIVRDMKALARNDTGSSSMKMLPINQPIEAALNLARNALKQVVVERRLDATGKVMASESKLGQVFVNLFINAAKAMAEDGRRDHRLRVSTFDRGRQLVVEISDDGPGIRPEVLPRIFDPFFTTKGPEQGTGLGLSICFSIVQSLGGQLSVRSEPGHGATFTIALPTSAVLASRDEPAAVVESPSWSGRLLLVDDDPLVQASLKRLFEGQHEVVVAGNGRAALHEVIIGREFDAIVCDIEMPWMTGPEPQEVVREMAPDLAGRFIFITGGLEGLAVGALEKPFDPSELRRRVHQVMRRRPEV